VALLVRNLKKKCKNHDISTIILPLGMAWVPKEAVQGQPLGIDIMYLVLADRNMQVRFGLKVVWES
jgi:hypothetical protein